MRTPHRIQVGTEYDDALALINDNFEKSVQDLSDLGASTTTSTSFITNSIAAGETFTQLITVLQYSSSPAANSVILSAPASGLRAAVPAIDLSIDSTASTNLYPTGSSLSAGQLAVTINATVALTTSGLAAYTISITNQDSSAHSYYVTTNLVYIPQLSNG